MKVRFCLSCLQLVVLGVLGLVTSAQGQEVVINEIMFHPGVGEPGSAEYVAEDTRTEFIELLNTSSASVHLKGWQFTKGVSFVFPEVTLAPGGLLVLSADADVNRFRSAYQPLYPGISGATIVGGWTGLLSNGGEEIELVNAAGKRVNAMTYATQGDWALRREADPYPGQPAWWKGWQWVNGADAGAKSLELINAQAPNRFGQNWAASRTNGGTPGGPNSVAALTIAPFVSDLRHRPAIPKSTDPVSVTVRLTPVPGTAVAVTLFNRIDGEAAFASVPMWDDGQHEDGGAGDGVYGARLGPQPDQTIVEFYVQVTAAGLARTWPAASDDQGNQNANALYQVDNTAYNGHQPIYRLIIPRAEYQVWVNLMDAVSSGRFSDATMHGALVTIDGQGTELRYNVGIRNRGAGTRSAHPHNLHLIIPDDHPWRGLTKLSLNTRMVHSQVAGSAFYSLAGLLNTFGGPVQVRINGANQAHLTPTGDNDSYQFGSYYAFQPFGREWSSNHVPGDSDGNIYKIVWYFDGVRLSNNGGDLRYLGDDPAAYRQAYSPTGPTASTGAYSKLSNVSEDNWSDLIELVKTLSTAPDDSYFKEVSRVINVDQWLRYFAASALLGNMETTLATGVGDDYSLFAGKVDRRFQILVHDQDTVLGQGDASPDINRSIFKAAEMPALARFLKHPAIAPRYYGILKELAETVFSPEQANATLDLWLGGWVLESVIQRMKDFVVLRRSAVLAQIPGGLILSSSLPVSAFPKTTNSSTTLSGLANAIETRSVLVNGLPAVWTASSASWSADNVKLNPGINRVLVQALGIHGNELDRSSIDIWSDPGPGTVVPGGTLTSNTTWLAAAGPYHVSNRLIVPAGVTLTIEPGTTLFFDSGAGMTVNGGRLSASGAPLQRIRFTRVPGSDSHWSGLEFLNAPQVSSTVAYADFDYGDASAQVFLVQAAWVLFDHVTSAHHDSQIFRIAAPRAVIRHSVFGDVGAHPIMTAEQETADGWFVLDGNLFGRSLGQNPVLRLDGIGTQLRDNVFLGSDADLLQANGSNIHIEGNVFMDAGSGTLGQNPGAAVSSRALNADSSAPRLTLVRNLFFSNHYGLVDQTGAHLEVFNNVFASNRGAIVFPQPLLLTRVGERACYIESSIFWHNVEAGQGTGSLVNLANPSADPAQLVVNNSLLPAAYHPLGSGNLAGDPRFVRPASGAPINPAMGQFSTGFEGWEAAGAALIASGGVPDLHLEMGSPAVGTGFNGVDMGLYVSNNASLAGAPNGLSSDRNPTVTVAGTDITGYRYRLIGPGPITNDWSAEIPIGPTAGVIQLRGLADGAYTLEVIRKNSIGWWQDVETPTRASWTVATGASPQVHLSEVLAYNQSAFRDGAGASPDAVELFNPSSTAVDLSGMGLSKSMDDPWQFAFPPGTLLGPAQYLVLWADTVLAQPGVHLGFGLNREGDVLYLVDRPANGGGLVDSVRFGLQLPNYSIGRMADGHWTLNAPTLGAANQAVALARQDHLRINEWFAAPQALLVPKFVELFNPDVLPVSLDGLSFAPGPSVAAAPGSLPPLSFIGGQSFAVFYPDAEPDLGANHLGFRLNSEAGAIGLFGPTGQAIDLVLYPAQVEDRSQGRSPDGDETMVAFAEPTPGGWNQRPIAALTNVVEQVLELVAFTNVWRYSQEGVDLGTAWRSTDFPDSNWPSGKGLFYAGANTFPAATNTALSLAAPSGRRLITYYFRTGFTLDPSLDPTANLEAFLAVDDGAAVYLNGVPVLKVGLPVNTELSYATRPSRTVSSLALEGPFLIPISQVRSGENVLAVEVHQVTDSSHDIAFGLALRARTSTTNIVPVVGLAALELSEVLARNQTLANSDGIVSDWIELHNPTGQPVDLADASLTDSPDQTRKWVFPPNSTISPGGYLVIECNPAAPLSASNTGFSLSGSDGAIFLFAPAREGNSLLDAVYYGLQVPDFSIGRSVAGEWVLTEPTPGKDNHPVTLGTASTLMINEWMADPDTGADWFELFNPGDRPVPLSGLSFSDDLTQPGGALIPGLSFIGTGQHAYQVFTADGEVSAGASHVDFKLSTPGESIGLFTADDFLIDGVSFGPQRAGTSEGRLPDGSPQFAPFPEQPTPGSANGESPLRLHAIGLTPSGFALSFNAAPQKSYTVQGRDLLGTGNWAKVADFGAQPAAGTIVVVDPNQGQSPSRYYRVVSPAVP